MQSPVLEIAENSPGSLIPGPDWVRALEAGKLLFFPQLSFALTEAERGLLRSDVRNPKSRNISLSPNDTLKGAAGDAQQQAAVGAMLRRFRAQARLLIQRLAPHYIPALRTGNGSFRPTQVEGRIQSLRADDRLLHVDAFPSRPNRGERILRVFCNINPHGVARVWRLGEPFEQLARRFLPLAKPWSPWQARMLLRLKITKSLRSEYDHLMLQLHDAMKADVHYQRSGPQVRVDFPAGSSWVCFSDQLAHAASSGQYLIEQTLYLPPQAQVDPATSPLAVLTRLRGHALV